tara:strand:+ start:239 stop:349 length:111 start_codon:yes stop_codon:yes gene_type:complete
MPGHKMKGMKKPAKRKTTKAKSKKKMPMAMKKRMYK